MISQLNNPWVITIFGGIIVGIILIVIKMIFFKKTKKEDTPSGAKYSWKSNSQTAKEDSTIINSDNSSGDSYVNININSENKDNRKNNNNLDINHLKKVVNILFIDDDVSFKIVKILIKQGWVNTKIVTDVVDLDKYKDVHIFFVDINGVGKKLELQKEGMDLAYFIKNKYKDKKVIIYSSDTTRDMSHPVFKMINGILPKNAQVYQFTDYIEEFAKELTF